MFKKVLILTAVVLLLSPCQVQADVIHSTWVGGEQGQWGNASNWSPAIVPDNGGVNTFFATIDSNYAGVDEVTVRLEQHRTIDRLVCRGDIMLHDWDQPWVELVLEHPNGLTNYGKLKIKGWLDFEICGTVLNNYGPELVLKNVDIELDVHNNAEGRINIRGEVDIDEGGVYNNGTISLIPGDILWAEFEFRNSGSVEIYGGSCSSDQAFTNEPNGVIKGFGGVHSNQVIHNGGIIQSLGGSLVLHSQPEYAQDPNSNSGVMNTGTLTNSPGTSLTVMVWVPDVNNQGTIEVNADGSVVFDSDFNNEPNGIIKLLGGTLAATTITQTADANFVGFGGIAGDVVIDPNGLIQLTGPTNILGDVEIRENATLEISDGTTLVTGRTTCNGTIHLKGGRIIPQGGLSGDCNIIWEPGLYTNIADFNLDGKVNIKDFALFADTWLWQTSWY